MSSINQIVDALSTINKHGQLIAEACLDNNGYIPRGNEAVIEELKRHRLCMELEDDDEQVVIIQPLRESIERLGVSRQIRKRSSHIGDLCSELEYLIRVYRNVESDRDEEKFYKEIDDCILSLIDGLRELTRNFSIGVYDRFRSVHSLDQRIKENQRALEEARSLTELFKQMDLSKLNELAGTNYKLQMMLKVRLLNEVKRCQTEITDAIHKLDENLTKLQEDQKDLRRYNKLIDGFLLQYTNNPGYYPVSFGEAPNDVLGVAPLKLGGSPPIGEEDVEDQLDVIAQNALKSSERRDKSHKKENRDKLTAQGPIEDTSTQEVPSETDPHEDIPRQLFEGLPTLLRDGPISMMEKYHIVNEAIEQDIWLVCILAYYRQMPPEETKWFTLDYITDPYRHYNGTRILRDIIIHRKNHVSAKD